MKLNADEFSFISHYWQAPVATLRADVKLVNRESVCLKEARKARLKSQYFVAAKLGMSRGGYDSLEKNEEIGSATVACLQRAAEAIDCEFVYSFRPKQNRTFRELIFETCLEFADRFPQIHRADPGNRRARFIASLASEALRRPKFKREQGWQRNEIRCALYNHLSIPTPTSGMP